MNHFVNHQQLLNHKIIKCGRDSTCCPRWRKVRPLMSYDYRNRVTRHTHTHTDGSTHWRSQVISPPGLRLDPRVTGLKVYCWVRSDLPFFLSLHNRPHMVKISSHGSFQPQYLPYFFCMVVKCRKYSP